jgi:DNA-binding transcriptional regulator GbsR (MarR family)
MDSKDNAARELIEETGKIFEKFGMTPMQGRIVAYFTVSDPPEKTFDELVKYFQASKSSVSNSLSFLLQNRIIDYRTYSTDRKRYFYITDSFFRVYSQKILENVRELKEQSFLIVSVRSPEHPKVNEKILKWIENANVLQELLETALADMKKDLV